VLACHAVIITEHISSKRHREIATHNDLISTIEELETVGAETILTLLPWNTLYWLLVTVGVLRSTAESERQRSIEAEASLDVHDGYAEGVCDRDVEIAA
jgi:hypothetical protein